MRIGMMLRALDEKGGVGMYARYLIEELLEIDERNEYVLFYRSPEQLGRFAGRPRVTERLLRPRAKPLWDQIAVPLACDREGIDVVFHPKFTVPLLTSCKSIMVVHGSDMFIPEHAAYYNPVDVRYNQVFTPLYCKKASVVISVSQITTDDFYRLLELPPGKVRTVYFGPARFFRRVEDREALDAVRARYGLPERFLFSLSKFGTGGGNRKNIDRMLEAYRLLHGSLDDPPPLVVGGKDCERYREVYGVPSDGWGASVLFPGFVDQHDLPAIYSQAALYLYPSNLEAFPIPLTEAMACGAPIVTSRVNGLKEIAGEGALFVDQTDPAEIAGAVRSVLADPELARDLSRKALERSKVFDWRKCARQTLDIIEAVHRNAA